MLGSEWQHMVCVTDECRGKISIPTNAYKLSVVDKWKLSLPKANPLNVIFRHKWNLRTLENKKNELVEYITLVCADARNIHYSCVNICQTYTFVFVIQLRGIPLLAQEVVLIHSK